MICVDQEVDYRFVKNLPAWKRKRWSHLLPEPERYADRDALDELRRFARRLGLRPEWEQRAQNGQVHYDLTEGVRARAIRLGAVEIAAAAWGRRKLAAYRAEMEGRGEPARPAGIDDQERLRPVPAADQGGAADQSIPVGGAGRV